MLDRLRSAVNSWPARILLGLVLLSFIVWGGHSAFVREPEDTLLTSGGASVSASVYNISLRNETLRLSMALGRYLTPDEIRRFDVPQTVFSRLYRNVLLDNEAAQLDLGASDKSAAALLSRDPLFQDKNGAFNFNAFNFYLRALGAPRDTFLNDFYLREAQRSQISSTLADGADAPDIFYKALALYAGQTRQADYVELQPEALNRIPDASEAALSAWFAANSAAFRTNEYRQVDYISLTPEDIAKPEEVPDAAIAVYYKTHQSAYEISPEKRSFMLARFAGRRAAESARAAIAAAIKAGAPAEAAYSAYFAKQSDVKPEIMAEKTQADLPGSAGAAAFSLKQGELSPVINALQGYDLILLQKVEAPQLKPQAEVSAQIKRDIAYQNALQALPDYRKKIEDARYDGANLEEIAAQYHLRLRAVTLDKNGETPQKTNAAFPEAETALPNIFAAAENTDADPLNLRGGGYLWYNVRRIIPPHDSALAEARNRAMAAWKQEQQRRRLDERADALAKALNGGADFVALAKSGGLVLRHAKNLRRTEDAFPLGSQAVSAIFAAMKGESGVASGAQPQNRIVFRVNSIAEPENAGRAQLSAAEQQNVARRMKADLLGLYIGAQAKETAVLVNRAVYNRLMQEQN